MTIEKNAKFTIKKAWFGSVLSCNRQPSEIIYSGEVGVDLILCIIQESSQWEKSSFPLSTSTLL